MSRTSVFSFARLATLLIALLASSYGCGAPAATSVPVATCVLQQLRIVNSGNVDLMGLTVLFPGPSVDAPATRIDFGDLPAGKATGYKDIKGGIYRYAAYEYETDGLLVNQAVVDWMGEHPMQGTKFTYKIKLDPSTEPGRQIELIEVVVDSP